MPLAGRIAVVTGASRGIGRAIALRLAQDGCDVAFNYLRSREAAEQLAQEISGLGRQALAVQADVSNRDQVTEFFSQITERFGTVHVLVNNAGITRDRYLMNMEPADWHEVIETNLTGAYHCTKAVIIPMMKQRAGSIVTVSSTAALHGMPGTVNYAAAKAGLLGMVRALSTEVGRYGVRCNAVAPGYISTEMISELPEKRREAALKQIPLGLFGEALDVANAVRFLVSDEARYVTGQVITVDGGLTA